MSRRLFCDTSVLIRYFLGDEPVRAAAAAAIVESDDDLVVSTAVLVELVHALRTKHGLANPHIAAILTRFLTRANVQVADADAAGIVAALSWSQRASGRRIPDLILAAAAQASGCDAIVSFDEKFASPTVPVERQ